MRRLRSKPVRRDEVFVVRYRDGWDLKTMPLGTYRRVNGKYGDDRFVGARVLWRPLLDELAAEENRQALPVEPPKPEFFAGWRYGAREGDCAHCGVRFLGNFGYHKRIRCCSNRCEAARAKVIRRQWRQQHPAVSVRSNASRTEKRAAARADRICEHCGVTIEAARSTRRYCSDICRVRAHHQRQGH